MTCTCKCHITADVPSLFEFAGVDTRNAIEAVIACAGCENKHVDVLLETKIWDVAPQRGVQIITPEGAKLSWDEYQQRREENRWPGEGPEA